MGAKVTGVSRADEGIAQFNLEAEPSVVSRGRALVAATLAEWSVQHLLEDAKLIAAELISNAVAATPGKEIRLIMCREARAVTLRVWDSSPDAPRMEPYGPYDETGRGMHIVAALAHEHGSFPATGSEGKFVWARLKI